MDVLPRLVELIRSDRLAFRRLSDDSGVLVELGEGRVLALNQTATFLVELMLSGSENVDDLTRRLVEEFEVDETTARRDIEACLAQLLRDLTATTGDQGQ